MITLNGYELSIDDPEGVLAETVNQYLATALLRDQAVIPTAISSQRPDRKSLYRPSLPLPNYSAPPHPPRVSTLWWPTGAARWARGYFLCSQTNFLQLLTSLGAQEQQVTLPSGQTIPELFGGINGPLTLVLDDQDSGTSITAEQMYLLCPRPITNTTGTNDDDVYLLPLVDARYYWQFVNFGILPEGNEQWLEWADLFTQLGQQLGVTINYDAPAPNYFKADEDCFSRDLENAAVLLDAVAHSLGQRIVVQLDGRVESQSQPTAFGIYQDL
ncbi:MAG TPA: hypothetical protein VG125_10535, partial [Pirellulales bacterium]|nr:hypothetical protein [Pirellulales bacterium]